MNDLTVETYLRVQSAGSLNAQSYKKNNEITPYTRLKK